MKNMFNFIIFLSLAASNPLAYGRIGCIDNSEHMQKARDSKEYHYVACNCPCERYPQLADRNKCSKCGHYHDISPYIIVSAKDLKPTKAQTK